ncbi:hypothetical protein N7476_007971 [Penicillium atrosanguineum]|uniref:Uncharacterized protein n=1 Tax=Penicillium atrosanguineum TaxID=1132637 RepID=A0A9W9PSQ5_9EURO|nr:hypothetical protein N7476_007971 [Penicillium atrosanguineum]
MEDHTKDNEPAPSYSDIFQRPANLFSGYTRVNQESDAEAGEIHNHGDTAVPLNTRPVDGQAHVHCEVCDRQMDRREKAKHKEYKCHVVSRTFILITLFMMIFGIVSVTTIHKGKK